jgi:gamma-glutamyltranspeptidase/glutathione hydrolase
LKRKKGGNAFDAMVATEQACHYAGNLGGGGFMVYKKWRKGTLDYREGFGGYKICFRC